MKPGILVDSPVKFGADKSTECVGIGRALLFWRDGVVNVLVLGSFHLCVVNEYVVDLVQIPLYSVFCSEDSKG